MYGWRILTESFRCLIWKAQTSKISLNKINLSKEKKEHVQKINFSLLKNFHPRKCNSIIATSVIKVGIQLQNFRVYFGFWVDTGKYTWKVYTQGHGAIMSNKVILRFMSYNITIKKQ